jgi:hypothetical protein
MDSGGWIDSLRFLIRDRDGKVTAAPAISSQTSGPPGRARRLTPAGRTPFSGW